MRERRRYPLYLPSRGFASIVSEWLGQRIAGNRGVRQGGVVGGGSLMTLCGKSMLREAAGRVSSSTL